MTKEEAMNIWLPIIKTGVETMPECKEALDMAVKALETLEQEPKWIPVSERLPEAEYGESDSVLVCFEDETQGVLYFNGGNWCYPTGETYVSVNHKNGWHNKVVAWMPLPEPYQAESKIDKSCSNCKYWLLDKDDENRKCKYCFEMDEWAEESEEYETNRQNN